MKESTNIIIQNDPNKEKEKKRHWHANNGFNDE